MQQEGEASAAWSAAVDTSNQMNGYNIRGILNFLQKNWSSFERDRASWEGERAELKAYIGFLEGERRGQNNLKRDLVRRIKMLEYALKQERAKYLALLASSEGKSGKVNGSAIPPPNLADDEPPASTAAAKLESKLRPAAFASTRAATKKSRHILRRYMQEMGLTDSMIQAEAEAVAEAVESSALFDAEGDAAIRPQMRLLLRHDSTSPTGKTLQTQKTVVELDSGAQQPQGASAAAPAAAAAAASAGQETHSAGAIPAPVPIVVETVGKKATVATEDEVLADFDFLSEDETAGADSTAAPAASAASSGSAAAPAASASASASAVDDVFASLDDAIEAGESSTTTTTTTTTTTEAPVSPAKSPVSATVVVSSPSASAPEADLQSFMPRKGSKARAGGVSKAAMAAAAAALASSEEEPEGNETKYDSNQLAKVMKHWDKTKPTSRKASHGKSSTKSPSKSSIMDMFGSSDDNDTNRGGNSVTEADVLGELADLSVAGDSEQGDQQRFDTESGSHHQWKPKYTFRGHFDSVRSIAFHDTEPAVLSASDDGTIKLWNFKNMPSGSKKSTHSPDLDPIYTYRGHTDAVTSIATSIKDGIFFTGSLDATVRVWRLYPLSQPAYANFDPLMSIDTFKGHTDAVWSLSVHPVHDILASISADKTCILWHFKNVANPLARKIVLGDVPTSVAFIHSTLSSFAISFASGKLVAYDNTTGNKVLDFERGESPSFINQVVSHPTLPLLITANDDKTIQFFDATGGQCTHSMVAHLDSVSTVAIDHSGLFLLSGGHDSSLRLWDIAKKSCLQEIASHRKKFDEAVHHVLFHPTLPFVASSGADASVKIYV